MTSRKRIHRSEVTPEEWITHRKLRKKIASAKWYAKKKQAEIEEERRIREELAVTLLPKPDDPIWPDRITFAHWHAALDVKLRGFPVRPTYVPVLEWVWMTRRVQWWLDSELPRTGTRGCHAGLRIPWTCTRFVSRWKFLAMGEWMQARREGATCQEWTCSLIGAAFTAWHLQQSQLRFGWGAVARAIHHVTTLSTMTVQSIPPPHPHNIPPTQNPTKNTSRCDSMVSRSRKDPPLIDNWDNFVCWMNQTLFDPWMTQYNQDAIDPNDTVEDVDSSWSEDARNAEEVEEDEDTDWMDAYIQPFLNDVIQPSSLDQYVHTHTTHPSGSEYDEFPDHGSADTSCDQSECWIFDAPNLPSTGGNASPGNLVHGKPINP